MNLRFALSGSVVFETRADAVPPVGAKVIFRMQQSKKGFEQNACVSAIVQGAPCAPVYDYSEGGEVVVSIDLDEFEELPSYDRP